MSQNSAELDVDLVVRIGEHAAEVPDVLGTLGLGVVRRVDGLHDQLGLLDALGHGDGGRPQGPRPAPAVRIDAGGIHGVQVGGGPGLPAVGGDVYADDGPSAAAPSVSFKKRKQRL